MNAHPLETPSSSVTVFRHDELTENTSMLSTSMLNHSLKFARNNNRFFGSRVYSPTEGKSSSRTKTEETTIHSSAKKTSNKKRPTGANSELCEYKSNLKTPKSDFPSPLPPAKTVRDFTDTTKLLNNITLDAPGPTLGTSPMIGKGGNQRIGNDRKSFFEISITEEMKNWERLFNIDHDIGQKIERQFEEIEGKFKNVEGEFENCLNLNKKIEQKLINLQILMKGVQFTKISSKNPKKSSQRSVFYSPYHEAICWKEIKAAFPKANQILSVRDITKVHTNYESFAKNCCKKNLGKHLSAYKEQDQACFLALESDNKVLMLIAPNENLKALFGKLISGLVRAQKKSGFNLNSSIKDSIDQTASESPLEFEFINNKYNDDIKNIRKEMSQAKQMFQANTLVLRKTFFETTQMLLKQERQNYREIRKGYRQAQDQLEKKQTLLLEVTNKNLDLQKELSEKNLKNKDLILKMKHLNDDNLLTVKEVSNMVDTLTRYLDSKKRKNQLDEVNEVGEDLYYTNSDIFAEIKNFEHSFILRESSDLLQKAKEMRIMINRLMFSHEKYLAKYAAFKIGQRDEGNNKSKNCESKQNTDPINFTTCVRCEQTKKNLGKQLSLNKEIIEEKKKAVSEKEILLKENEEIREKLQLYVNALEELHSKFLEIVEEIDKKKREFSDFAYFAQREVENYNTMLTRQQREHKQLEFTTENLERQYLRELENKDKKIADLSSLRTDLQKSLEKLIGENKEYVGRISFLEKSLRDSEPLNNEKSQKLELEIVSLNANLKSLEKELNEEKARSSEPKRELEDKIMTLTNLLREQKSQILTFQNLVRDLEEKRKQLENELNSAHTTISEKHSKIIYYKENLRKLKLKYDSQKKSELNHNETIETLNHDLSDTRSQAINLIVLITLIFSPDDFNNFSDHDKENQYDSCNILSTVDENSFLPDRKDEFNAKFERAFKHLSERLCSKYKKETVVSVLESLQLFYQKLFYQDDSKFNLKNSSVATPVMENIDEQSENFLDINEKNIQPKKFTFPSPRAFYLKESLLLKAGEIMRRAKPSDKTSERGKSRSINKEGRLSVSHLDASSILESSPHHLETSCTVKGQLLENFISHLTPKNYVRVQKPNEFSPFDSEKETRLPTTANYSNNKELINYSQNKELIHSFIEIQSQKKKVNQAANTIGAPKDSSTKAPVAIAGDKPVTEFVVGNRKRPTIFHNRALSTNMSPQISFTQFLDTIFSKK